MAVKLQKTLRQLRNTRDLRAEILALAAELTSNRSKGQLTVSDPVISEGTVQHEWERLMPAITPDVRGRMSLSIEPSGPGTAGTSADYRIESGILLLDRPNYRFEVLRLLLGASLEDDGPQPIKGLIEKIGSSQTPIREALAELKQAQVVQSRGRGVEVIAEDITTELLAKVRALPQVMRFRFERGTKIKPPAELLKRVDPLLGASSPLGWRSLSLSGMPVARANAPSIDLMGMPRLDLVASLPRDEKAFDATLLRMLDDGLELEPNVLAPAPVVVTLVRADTLFVRNAGLGQMRCACPMDVFLSLLDMGLREQALQYAKVLRQ